MNWLAKHLKKIQSIRQTDTDRQIEMLVYCPQTEGHFAQISTILTDKTLINKNRVGPTTERTILTLILQAPPCYRKVQPEVLPGLCHHRLGGGR